MDILMLCCDEGMGEPIVTTLSHHEVDVFSDYAQIKNASDMYGIFGHDTYDLLILTNMGIPSALAMRHVSMLPDVRNYRTVLFSSHLTRQMIEECKRRDVDFWPVPVSRENVLIAIDGPAEPVPVRRRQRQV